MTGGSRGIGEMIAAGFLANGAKVYISSRKAGRVRRHRRAPVGGLRRRVHLDPRRPVRARRASTSLAAALAGRESHLDVLVNNAGVSWGASIDEFPENGLGQGDGHQRQGRVLPHPASCCRCSRRTPRRRSGPGHQHRLDRRHPDPVVRHRVLRPVEGRRPRAHPPAGGQARPAQHPRQRHRPRAVPDVDAEHRRRHRRRRRGHRLGRARPRRCRGAASAPPRTSPGWPSSSRRAPVPSPSATSSPATAGIVVS